MKRYFFQCQLRRRVVFAQSLEIHWHLFRRKSSNTKTNCKIKRIRSLDRPVRLMPNIVYIILNENINFRIIKWCEPCVLINLYAYFSRFTCHQQKAILTKKNWLWTRSLLPLFLFAAIRLENNDKRNSIWKTTMSSTSSQTFELAKWCAICVVLCLFVYTFVYHHFALILFQ